MWDVSNTATTHDLTLVAYKVMKAGIYLYMMRFILTLFGLASFGYSYTHPGYWTDFGYAAITNLTVLPMAIVWYFFQWRLYPLNRQGSSMTMRRTPFNPKCKYDKGIVQLIKMNAFLEACGILFWTAVFVSMILSPSGQNFRLTFEKPPTVLWYIATGAAGLQIILCLAQNWLLIRERQFIKIHVDRCKDHLQPARGFGIDNFEQVEMRPLPQRSIYPSPSMASMNSVTGSGVHPASFV
ncbi:hypothetical protein MMC18_005507 [Xylographa bjoerkii]|nr:hypothetical protein [Xylographa bjoerkii]